MIVKKHRDLSFHTAIVYTSNLNLMEYYLFWFFGCSFLMRRIVIVFLARTRKFNIGLRAQKMQRDLILMKFIMCSMISEWNYECNNRIRQVARQNLGLKRHSLQSCNHYGSSVHGQVYAIINLVFINYFEGLYWALPIKDNGAANKCDCHLKI